MRAIVIGLLCLAISLNAQNLMANSKEIKSKVAILYSDKFLLHDTGPDHPERPERLTSTVNFLKNHPLLSPYLTWPKFKPATFDILNLVHTKEYIKLVEHEINTLKNTTAYLSTGDTVISKHTLEAASLAVSAGTSGIDEIMTGKVSSAFALVRPPGHHATASHGMGFCVFNNIAIATRYLQKFYGLERILIVDFDVHHGNGTQDIFYEDDSVFYFSVHQHPFYPGTGRPTEKGSGPGKGYTLNVDLPAGSGDEALINSVKAYLEPAMQKFKPEFILVSAGFDAHQGDLLGQLNYTKKGYKQVAKILHHIADLYASNRTLYMLEGGYTPDNITQSVNEILNVLVEFDKFN